MAVTLDHTENNALSWSDASPAKGITALAIIDAGDGAYYEYVNIVLPIAADANIDGSGVNVHVFYSADSSDLSDFNTKIFNILATDINNTTLTFAIKLAKFNYVKIGVENDTTTEGEVTPTGKWEGLKVTDS